MQLSPISFLMAAILCHVIGSNFFTVMLAVWKVVMVVVDACFSNLFCANYEENFVFPLEL